MNLRNYCGKEVYFPLFLFYLRHKGMFLVVMVSLLVVWLVSRITQKVICVKAIF